MPETVRVTSKRALLNLPSIQELFEYRYLLYVFVIRDYKVRYRQTIVGVLWAIIKPLVTTIVFCLFFGNVLHLPSGGIPYPVFFYSGVLLWGLFANGLTASSNSIVQNSMLITRVYFPRLYLPFVAVVKACIDYVFASSVLIVLLIYFSIPFRLSILYIIPISLCTAILTFAVGLLFSGLNVRYRDIQHILPFTIQTLFYMSPVLYPSSATVKYSWLFLLNPMTGYVYAHRAAILGQDIFAGSLLAISLIETVVLLCLGIVIFRRAEYYFADFI